VQKIIIQPADPASPDVRALIEQLDRYLGGLYPAESNHLLSVDGLRQPHVTFLAAMLDSRLVGCGAMVNHHGEYAELKRVFVLPQCRGLKIGRLLVAELEARARSAGLAVVRLETGIHQPEALRLFERAGYRRRDPFGDYGPDPLSVFMEKRLGQA
jgi:putative acetyltransferase